jgi:hypothetical protein
MMQLAELTESRMSMIIVFLVMLLLLGGVYFAACCSLAFWLAFGKWHFAIR